MFIEAEYSPRSLRSGGARYSGSREPICCAPMELGKFLRSHSYKLLAALRPGHPREMSKIQKLLLTRRKTVPWTFSSMTLHAPTF